MQPPFGTPCANHPDTPASATCSQCGRAVCNTCVVFDRAGAARCPACAAPSAATGGSAVPWERRAELGTTKAFVDTVKSVLVRPGDALAPPGGPPALGAPFVFALICQSIGALFATLWQVGFSMLTTDGRVGAGELGVVGGLGLFSGPFLAVWAMFLWGGIVHLGLLILSAARGGFAATARVQGYASASALWNVVPFFGGMVGFVWGLVVQVIGLARAHETSTGRTLGAVLAPLALCCLGAIGLIGLSVYSFAPAFQ